MVGFSEISAWREVQGPVPEKILKRILKDLELCLLVTHIFDVYL